MDPQPGETSRHVGEFTFTKQNSFATPSVMAGHKHGRTLRMLLLKAGMKAQFGTDELAKASCLEPLKAQIISLLEDYNSTVCVIRDDVVWGIWWISKRLSNKYREWSWLRLREKMNISDRCWNAIGSEDDRPKLDKERSLGYTRRAKRR
eukprot:611563-Prorocentrum_minimum.AAC.1